MIPTLRTPKLAVHVTDMTPAWQRVYWLYRAHGYTYAANHMRDIINSGHRPDALYQLLKRQLHK